MSTKDREFWDGKVPKCPECGAKFDNVFDAVQHSLEDDESFDPVVVLPKGFKLMVGSLLKYLYFEADDAEEVRHIVSSAYMTLFAAEYGMPLYEEMTEEILIDSAMENLDDELKNLLKDGE